MQQFNPILESTLCFEVYYSYEFNCWFCGVSLDIEDKLFANRCHTCNASQGYDKEDFE